MPLCADNRANESCKCLPPTAHACYEACPVLWGFCIWIMWHFRGLDWDIINMISPSTLTKSLLTKERSLFWLFSFQVLVLTCSHNRLLKMRSRVAQLIQPCQQPLLEALGPPRTLQFWGMWRLDLDDLVEFDERWVLKLLLFILSQTLTVFPNNKYVYGCISFTVVAV